MIDRLRNDVRLLGTGLGVLAALAFLFVMWADGFRTPLPLALGAGAAVAAGALTGFLARPSTSFVVEHQPEALSFLAVPAGGLLGTAEAMARIEEELGVAAEYKRPLCLGLIGIDAGSVTDLPDALEGLRQLTTGAVRRADIVTDRGPGEVLVAMPETHIEAGWLVAERIRDRAGGLLGTLRAVVIAPAGHEPLRELLAELDGGLEACRAMNLAFADPKHLLAAQSNPG